METDSAGYAIQFEYDRDGNQTVRRTTGGYELHTSYDLNGRPTTESDNLGMHRRYQYDPLGRVREVVDGEGSLASSTIYLYHAPGRGVRVERPDGTFEFVEHNERGRPIRREWGARGSDSILVEIFTHDVFDRLVRVDAGAKDGLVTKFSATYLDDKRESAVFDALGNVTRTVYDSEGRPAHKTDAEGRKLSYEYDEAGRITRRRAEDGSVHSSYEYDALGRRVAAHEGAVSHSWRFDGGGRVVCHEQRVGRDAGAVSYEYDNAGRLTGKAYDDEWWMRFEYYANSHFVNRVRIPSATIDLTVDPSGRVLREGWGDSGHTVYEYSPGGPLSVVDHFDGRGRLIFGQSFEHDHLGRPSRETRRNGAGEVTYLNRYDPFNRLERVDTADSGSAAEFRRYVYDEWGNRLEEYRGGELYTAFCYDTADRLTEKRDSRGDVERHEYDKCGNLIRKGSQSCRYDSAQRLREVTNVAGGADIISFGYSATDIRVTVERADVAEHLFYDDLQEIISSLPRERTLTFWGFTLDALLAASDSSKFVRKAFTNSQGSVVGFEGAEHLEDYDPFGVPLSGDRPQLRFGFCGKRYDSETSLYYNRARFYDPHSGRFTQPDAKGLVDGTNLFTYANSNPVTFNDTLGFKSSKSSQGRVARAYDSLFSPQLDITSMRGLKMAHYDPAGHKVGTTYFKEKSLFKTERLEHYNLEGEKIGETYFKEKSLFDVGHLRHYTPGGELSGKSYYKESTFFNPGDRLQHYDVNSEIVGKTYFQPRTFTQLPHFEHYRPDRSPYDFIRKPMGSSYIMKA
jgi:RHS repeat-associated protein